MSGRNLLLSCLAIACLLVAFPARGATEEEVADFRKARTKISQRLRSKDLADRQGALADLQKYPLPDAVRMVLPIALDEKTPEVRQAAYRTLVGYCQHAPLAELLLNRVRQDLRRKGFDAQNVVVLGAVATSPLPEIQQQLLAELDPVLGTPKANGLLMVELIEGLAAEGNDDALRALALFRQTRHYRENFGFRRLNLQVLTEFRKREAMDVLMEAISLSRGEIARDLLKHFAQVTGLSYGSNVPAWTQWWAAQREKFEFPLPGEQPKAADVDFVPAAAEDPLKYYGLSLQAERVVFVIDISGSMRGERLAATKRELIRVLEGLPDGVHFNVMPFSSAVYRWERKPMPMSSANRASAIRYVLGLQASGTTSSYDALDAALNMEPETVYFLTDGAPTTGKIVDPVEILRTINQVNRVARSTINVIGIAPGVEAIFLRELAGGNWGEYRDIQE